MPIFIYVRVYITGIEHNSRNIVFTLFFYFLYWYISITLIISQKYLRIFTNNQEVFSIQFKKPTAFLQKNYKCGQNNMNMMYILFCAFFLY